MGSPIATVPPSGTRIESSVPSASAIESDSLGIVSSCATAATSVLELACCQLVRERRRETAFAHAFQLLVDLALELVQAARFDAFGFELRAEEHDRVARLPLVELSLGPVRAGIAARVTDEPVRQRLDERGSVPAAYMCERPRRGVAHRPDAHPVD